MISLLTRGITKRCNRLQSAVTVYRALQQFTKRCKLQQVSEMKTTTGTRASKAVEFINRLQVDLRQTEKRMSR